MDTFDIEQRWPELFEPLDDVQRTAVVQTLASSWQEGCTPTRDVVENLTAYAAGKIDVIEYQRRSDAIAEAGRRRTMR